MQLTDDRKNLLLVHLPDTRGVEISPYGKGNLKLGANVYTYSRVAGQYALLGTCPGSTDECEDICYAKRIGGPVLAQYRKNSLEDTVPAIPSECTLLRIHVSGDFNSLTYIHNWIARIAERPDVQAWAYTRSWRVPSLLGSLDVLRDLPNMQLFASMDISTRETPPADWRIAWIDGDPRAGEVAGIEAHSDRLTWLNRFQLFRTKAGTKTLICPEETNGVANCEACTYCFAGVRNDVTFLKH